VSYLHVLKVGCCLLASIQPAHFGTKDWLLLQWDTLKGAKEQQGYLKKLLQSAKEKDAVRQ
jgi:hypothetical protein